MENKFFGTPPDVNQIKLDPKFECNDLSGYHIKANELELIRNIVNFIGYFGSDIRDTRLDEMVERFNGSVPIDDASLLDDGDGIASIGPHTDNPAEDIETIAKIAMLMRHVILNVDKLAEELAQAGEAKFQEVTDDRIKKLHNRITHFARNITDSNKSVGISGGPRSQQKSKEDEVSDFVRRVLETTRQMGQRAVDKNASLPDIPAKPKDGQPSRAEIEAALRKMSEDFN